jgi:hypothetical protein
MIESLPPTPNATGLRRCPGQARFARRADATLDIPFAPWRMAGMAARGDPGRAGRTAVGATETDEVAVSFHVI